MAIQKKSMMGKRTSVKKALVARRVSTDVSKAEQIKAPLKSVKAFAPQKSFALLRSPIKGLSPVKFLG
ncbi:MAG: hypothetical protein WB952_06635 [Terriglobales bacterium]